MDEILREYMLTPLLDLIRVRELKEMKMKCNKKKTERKAMLRLEPPLNRRKKTSNAKIL